MQPSSMHYFPLALPFILAFALPVLVMIVLIELGLLKLMFDKHPYP